MNKKYLVIAISGIAALESAFAAGTLEIGWAGRT